MVHKCHRTMQALQDAFSQMLEREKALQELNKSLQSRLIIETKVMRNAQSDYNSLRCRNDVRRELRILSQDQHYRNRYENLIERITVNSKQIPITRGLKNDSTSKKKIYQGHKSSI